MLTYQNFTWDITIYNRDHQLTAVIEVRNKLNTSSKWAAKLRQNLLSHGFFPQAPYFLIVFPDYFYLWTDATTKLTQSEPDYIIDANPILQPYFEQAGVSANQVTGESLELIITSWLGEIIYSEKFPEALEKSQQWLIESGFYQAIVGGHFLAQGRA